MSDTEAFDRSALGSSESRRTMGVHVIGYLRTESGLGEAARRLIHGLTDAGIPYSAQTFSETPSRQKIPFEDIRPVGDGYPVNIVCVNADALPAVVGQYGRELFDDRYTIGVWFWETSILPRSMHVAFDLVDEVWVSSSYVADSIRAETEKPVHVFPLPVVVSDAAALARKNTGFPPGFVFLFCFDFLSVFERKNPLAVIEAFTRAFAPGEGPTLVIKSINADQDPEQFARLRAAAADRKDVKIVDGYVSVATKDAMIANCGCYVSLHRSEGFGFTMAEAMLYGRPVIATANGGNTTFMTEENSFLVPFSLVPISPDAGVYAGSGEWAEPDVERAAELMRWVVDHPEEAESVAARGQREASAQLSPSSTGAFVAQRLNEIEPLLDALPRREMAIAGTVTLRTAEIAIAGGVGGARFPGAVGRRSPTLLARRGLWRMLFPFLQYQHQVDRAFVETLRGLVDANRALELRVAELEKERGGGSATGAGVAESGREGLNGVPPEQETDR